MDELRWHFSLGSLFAFVWPMWHQVCLHRRIGGVELELSIEEVGGVKGLSEGSPRGSSAAGSEQCLLE